MRYVIVPLPEGRWIWELRDSAGHVLCKSEDSYASHENAFDVIADIRAGMMKANIVSGTD